MEFLVLEDGRIYYEKKGQLMFYSPSQQSCFYSGMKSMSQIRKQYKHIKTQHHDSIEDLMIYLKLG